MVSPRPILLVEDNPDDERLILRSLKQSRITNSIGIARDGEQALNYLATISLLPSVVLLDIKLPKIDGLEVLRTIRSTERTQLLPVVILTSSSEEQDLIESYNLGANSYVRKPVEFEQFHRAISQLGMYWLLINDPPLERTPE